LGQTHPLIGKCFSAIVLACPVTAQTVRKAIDFEDRNAGDIIFDQYPGIVFVGGDSADRPVV